MGRWRLDVWDSALLPLVESSARFFDASGQLLGRNASPLGTDHESQYTLENKPLKAQLAHLTNEEYEHIAKEELAYQPHRKQTD